MRKNKLLLPEIPITMVRGLLAFEDVLQYTLKGIKDNSFFFLFEAEEGTSFILTKPGFFFNDYSVKMNRQELGALKISDTATPEVYCIVTVPDQVAEMTANLLAPLFINEKEGLGMQIILENTPYMTRHYLFPPEKRLNCG